MRLRLLALTISVAVLAAVVVAPRPAGAATVSSVNGSPPTRVAGQPVGTPDLVWTPFDATNGTVDHQAKQADKALSKANGDGTEAPSVICCGWGTVLLVLHHSDVTNLLYTGLSLGAAAFEIYLCGFLPGWITTGVCIFAVAALWGSIVSDLWSAEHQVTWEQAWWCLNVPSNGYCPADSSGSGLLPFFWDAGGLLGGTWIQPVYVSGLNILFTWVGIPIGFQVNPYSG
jgi:hypothetical protein